MTVVLVTCFHVFRVLLHGAPSDSTIAAALQDAALEIALGLPQQGNDAPKACSTAQSQSSLQALLTVLMWGLAGITQAQLHVAAREILHLVGACVTDTAIKQLSQQLR